MRKDLPSSYIAAQRDKLEWKGGKQSQSPDRSAGSNPTGDEDLHPKRIYSHSGHSSQWAQLNPGAVVCSSASESRHHLCSSGVSPLTSVELHHHGFKTSSFPLLIELTCRLLTCSSGKVSSFLFSFHSCPFPAICPTPFLQAGNISVQEKGSLGHFSWMWLKFARFRKTIHGYFSLKPQSVKLFKIPSDFLHFTIFNLLESYLHFGNCHQKFQMLWKNEKNPNHLQLLWIFSFFCTSSCLGICVPIPTLKKNLSTSLMPLKRPWQWRKVILRKGP